MKKKELPADRWVALNGKDLKNESVAGATVATDSTQRIVIQETLKSFDLDNEATSSSTADPVPYGIPITAKLAIGLIADYQNLIRKINSFLQSDPKASFQSTQMFIFKSIRDIFFDSSAITIDKNVLLKTLSQPGCEGIRFYPCLKNVGTSSDPNLLVSLVTVGVDSEGHDLHYYYFPDVVGSDLRLAALNDKSMLSEYGSPPPPYNKDKHVIEEGPFGDKYAILKYALDQLKNITE